MSLQQQQPTKPAVPELSQEELEQFWKDPTRRKNLPFAWKDLATGLRWCRFLNCPMYSKDDIHNVNRHYKASHLHIKERICKEICPECDYTTPNPYELRRHLNGIHHQTDRRKEPCPNGCSRAWVTDLRHVRIHRAEYCPQRKNRERDLLGRNWDSRRKVVIPTSKRSPKQDSFRRDQLNFNSPPTLNDQDTQFAQEQLLPRTSDQASQSGALTEVPYDQTQLHHHELSSSLDGNGFQQTDLRHLNVHHDPPGSYSDVLSPGFDPALHPLSLDEQAFVDSLNLFEPGPSNQPAFHPSHPSHPPHPSSLTEYTTSYSPMYAQVSNDTTYDFPTDGNLHSVVPLHFGFETPHSLLPPHLSAHIPIARQEFQRPQVFDNFSLSSAPRDPDEHHALSTHDVSTLRTPHKNSASLHHLEPPFSLPLPPHSHSFHPSNPFEAPTTFAAQNSAPPPPPPRRNRDYHTSGRPKL